MTRPSLSTVAYEALVRARRKFSNREEHCIRETWTAEQELVLLRLYPDMPNEVLATRLNKTVQQIYAKAHRLGLKKSPELAKQILQACGRKLQDEEKPLDIERAKAVAHVSSVIIESAKVEVKALEIIGAPGGSTFMQIGREDSK